jgi:DNA-3-methyladenine glycosylase II
MTPLDQQLAHLAAADPDLGRAIGLVGPLPDRTRAPGFPTLLRIMCDQQLSTASAAAIWARIEAGLTTITPDRVRGASDDDLRALGLSRPKVRYARALAEAIALGTLDLDAVARMDDVAAAAALTSVVGIGRWTAEVYLLFALGRTDIWPADDLALQEALKRLKRMRARPDRRRMDREAKKWRPYRGAAARVLWAYYRVSKPGFEMLAANKEMESA